MGKASCAEARGRGLPSWASRIRAVIRVALVSLGLYLLLLLSIGTSVQATEPNGEYILKSAFLFNFAKFVEWPDTTFANDATPFTICALGNDSFGSSLNAIVGKTVQNRALAIKRLRSIGEVKDCQILYVSPNELTHTAEIVRTLQQAPVLTVCDVESCAEEGIMLNMRMVENRVQLDMNLDAVQRTSLHVSSQLIKLTRIVKGNQ